MYGIGQCQRNSKPGRDLLGIFVPVVFFLLNTNKSVKRQVRSIQR